MLGLQPRHGLRVATIATFAALLSLGGCDKEDKIFVENTFPSEVNRPPAVLVYSPEFTPAGFEQIANYSSAGAGFRLTVIVGDPDGLDDIAAVAVDIDAVSLKRFILRADTSSTSCPAFSYAPNDTVPTAQILATPAAFPGVALKTLSHSEAGIYYTEAFGGYGFGFPDIFAAASNLARWGGGCSTSDGAWGMWTVLSPVLPAPRTALLTYADVEYTGIRIRVWDSAGASATMPLPDLKVVYTTEKQKKGAI